MLSDDGKTNHAHRHPEHRAATVKALSTSSNRLPPRPAPDPSITQTDEGTRTAAWLRAMLLEINWRVLKSMLENAAGGSAPRN